MKCKYNHLIGLKHIETTFLYFKNNFKVSVAISKPQLLPAGANVEGDDCKVGSRGELRICKISKYLKHNISITLSKKK